MYRADGLSEERTTALLVKRIPAKHFGRAEITAAMAKQHLEVELDFVPWRHANLIFGADEGSHASIAQTLANLSKCSLLSKPIPAPKRR